MGFRETIKHAFAMPKEAEKLTEEEEELLGKLAQEIVKRRLEAVAITSLESVKYLHFIGSQLMLFFKPIVDTVFPTQMYGKVQEVLEKRGSVEYLIQAIEKAT
jgi:hypothetical protein